MAPYAVIITKTVNWHGRIEEWSSVYHYDTGVAPSEQGWSDLIDAIVAAERPLYGSGVLFKSARVHGPTNEDPEDDQMRFAKDLSLGGTSVSGIQAPPESCVVVEWSLGRSARGYKQLLKKFHHAVTIEGTSPSALHANGVNKLDSTHKAKFLTYGNAVKAITIGANTNNMCNAQGENFPASEQPTVLDYTYTRQFRKGRKRRTTTP